MGGASRQATEEELRQLCFNENLLIDQVLKDQGTMKEKIIAIAEIKERRIDLLDERLPTGFLVSDISSQISRELRPHPISHLVRRYLPNKYKKMSMIRAFDLIDHLNSVIEDCGHDVRKGIQECTNFQLEIMLEFSKKSSDLADDVKTFLTNHKWYIRAEALRRGIDLGGEKYRDEIPARDYRYEIPDYFGLKELNDENIFQGNRIVAALDKFYNDKYRNCPAHYRQLAFQFAHASRVMANVLEVVNEDKWSGEMEFWFDREYHNHVQSAHAAGNSTFFPTTLCAYCSRDVAEDPQDFARMKYWRPSPTHYICNNCGGIEIQMRENTREQLGDKDANVLRDAADLLNHLPFYEEMFKDYRDRVKNPEIYARKNALHLEFQGAAFGKDKIVVPRKIQSQLQVQIEMPTSSNVESEDNQNAN